LNYVPLPARITINLLLGLLLAVLLRDLEQRLVVPVKLHVLQLGGADLLDVGLVDLALVLLGRSLDPAGAFFGTATSSLLPTK